MPVREPITLTKEDIDRLKDLETDIDWLSREIARAEAVGIDVTELKAEYEKSRTLREGLIREYAPKE